MEILSAHFTIGSYECITMWLEKAIVNEVFNNHENNKHAGTIIEIIKKIMKKAKPPVKMIVKSFVISQFLKYQKA